MQNLTDIAIFVKVVELASFTAAAEALDMSQPVVSKAVTRLEEKLGVPILNLAKAGDEVRYMLGVKEDDLRSIWERAAEETRLMFSALGLAPLRLHEAARFGAP